ncbi:hypothetical protein [Deinococcus cellulosilyticus]|uniref:Uncharacterized protein n=1 Tax=Deinococcus cellulosilyticus (strain DSM 18568 / NBRC 106333 / KACC 11606 / 5516J-15) TaxID=1223518 RepID=A0A511N0D1_DEIC1|nr:hypothetical protein [Deinococcus cellulosilyticus]GEM46340.1 hypothetical protein DC3_19750 [Deinococcus cellulosilyticus NBRC 106333 = KACC 11606]
MHNQELLFLVQRDLAGVKATLDLAEEHPDPDGRSNLLHRAQMRLQSAKQAAEKHQISDLQGEVLELHQRLENLQAAGTCTLTP